MMDNLPNLLVAVAAVAMVVFGVANAMGNDLGGYDAKELERIRTLISEGEAELVDVRTPREFAADALEGAKNIPVQNLQQRLDEVGDKDDPVMVYCRSGNRSARAARILEKAGFEEVYDLGSRSAAEKIVEGAE